MYLAYSLLLTLGLIVLIPRFLFQAITHGKYMVGFRQRLGSIRPLHVANRPVVWLHCVSVGESQAARPLVNRLRSEFPGHALVVSTITMTGQKLAREVFREQADAVIYFPFDFRWSVRRALSTVNPSLVLLMETELWPNFLRECHEKEIPVALVNGRISRQSFRRYNLLRSFVRRMLSSLSVAIMQADTDAERVLALGLSPDKLHVSGNLKFDVPGVTTSAQTEEIKTRFGLDSQAPLILAASTHAPEEKILLESFSSIRDHAGARLMIAPRHPERFSEVASLIQDSKLTWTRRTDQPKETDKTAKVILLDTIGELPSTYSLASIVFVGGSLIDKGGHNVLEPAAAGTCVVTGAHTHNFEAIVRLLNGAGALVQLPEIDPKSVGKELTRVFTNLLQKPELRDQLATRAAEIVRENRGASGRTIEFLRPFLTTASKADRSVKP